MVTSLREHLVHELNDLLSAEEQLIEALPEMVKKASQKQLKAAFRSHLAQTRSHARRVNRALILMGEKASNKTCDAMRGLLEEGEELADGAERGALLDAMLITAAQKVEHYEIATYGTVRTYAQVVGQRDVEQLLDRTLREEKAADKKLTTIAERSVNARAAKEWHEDVGAFDMLQKGAAWIGSTVGETVNRALPQVQASDRRGSRPTARTTSKRKARSKRASRGR